MYVSGDGFTTFLCHIKPEFKPKTTLALKWVQASNGVWSTVDRGVTSDIYESEIRIYSKEETINTMINAIYANRIYDTNYFTMSGFLSTEHIFGEDIDYSGNIQVTIVAIEGPVQKTWLGYEATLTVRALSPTFTYASTLPTLQYLDYGYKGTIEDLTINKYDSYYGNFTYLDHTTDIGIWTGTLLFTSENMGKMRRYITTQRGSTVTINSINGVDYPFGPTRPTFPITCKILKWDDLGMVNPNNWKMSVTLAEVV